jgi:hypothetical protein
MAEDSPGLKPLRFSISVFSQYSKGSKIEPNILGMLSGVKASPSTSMDIGILPWQYRKASFKA